MHKFSFLVFSGHGSIQWARQYPAGTRQFCRVHGSIQFGCSWFGYTAVFSQFGGWAKIDFRPPLGILVRFILKVVGNVAPGSGTRQYSARVHGSIRQWVRDGGSTHWCVCQTHRKFSKETSSYSQTHARYTRACFGMGGQSTVARIGGNGPCQLRQ